MSSVPADSLAERPLEGTKFCCTSILPEDRVQLATWVEDMGAEHTLDLTSDVTHLLVGDSDSEKYKYVAREREDVKVLLPTFVAAVRDLWMNHQPINFNVVEAQYRYPTLYGQKISITGFDHQEFRDQLANRIASNGAAYSGDLTKEVTLLIANAPEGKKYQYATGWGLKIVSIKWLEDSLKRGMQLDVTKYHPSLPPHEQGLGAWNREPIGSPKFGKRDRSGQAEEKRSRKIRRTVSARFGSQQNEVWNNIVGQQMSDAADRAAKQVQSSETHVNPRESSAKAAKRPIHDQESQDEVALQPAAQLQAQAKRGIFAGRHFAFRGFDERKSQILQQYLAGHDGEIHSASELVQHPRDGPLCSFVILPHDVNQHNLSQIRIRCGDRLSIVSELWLEHCVSIKAFCSAKDYLLGQPITPINLPAISNLVVNASGFPQIQLSHIAKVVKQIGAKYEETFTAQTSVLICNTQSLNKQKLKHAQEWNVPIVSEIWLLKMIETQRIPSFEPYLLLKPLPRKIVPTANLHSSDAHQNHTKNDQAPQTRLERAVESAHQLSDGFDQGAPKKLVREEPAQNGIQRLSKHTINTSRAGPLQELSENAQNSKPMPAPSKKKKLFQQMDGPMSDISVAPDENLDLVNIEPEPVSLQVSEKRIGNVSAPVLIDADTTEVQDQQYQSRLVAEFLEVKAAAEAKAASEAVNGSNKRGKHKRLLGRALSNISNSSKRSNENHESVERERQPLSRASSINSANTDGLGMPLSMMSRIPSDLQNKSRDVMRENTNDAPTFDAALLAFGTSQVPRPASPTASQMPVKLTYAESEEAAALKAHLAEKRRKRAKLGQKQGDPEPELSREESEELRQRLWREREAAQNALGILQDDEAVVGVGRRTRGREKALSKLFGEGDDLLEL